MKLSRYTKIGMAALGALLVVWLVLMLFSDGSGGKVGPAREDLTHCPDCGMMLNKSGECPKCMAEQGVEVYRSKRANKGFASNPAIAYCLGGMLVVLVTVHLVVVFRNRSRGGDEEVYYHVRCTKCGRKLRFRERQIGHTGRCPLCQKPILFPPPEEEGTRGSRWTKIVHTLWG